MSGLLAGVKVVRLTHHLQGASVGQHSGEALQNLGFEASAPASSRSRK